MIFSLHTDFDEIQPVLNLSFTQSEDLQTLDLYQTLLYVNLIIEHANILSSYDYMLQENSSFMYHYYQSERTFSKHVILDNKSLEVGLVVYSSDQD